jgi:hypothetical protein
MTLEDEEEPVIVLDQHDYNELQEELHRLRGENAELRRDAQHYFDAMMDIIHGRRMYPRRSCC